MKQKRIEYTVSGLDDYLSIYNGMFGLTRTETQILSEFIKVHLALKKTSLQINPFATEMKRIVAIRLGKDNYHTLNTYIKALSDKGAIIRGPGGYRIHPYLIPEGEQEIIITLKRGKKIRHK